MKKFIIDCIEQARGDDLQRAKLSFEGLDMSLEHGQSGRSRQSVLDGYIAHDDKCNAAIDFINNRP